MKQRDLDMAKTKVKKKQDEPIDSELQNIIEAALYAATEPLGIRNIMGLFPQDAQPTKVEIQNVILALEEKCEHRGIELRRIGKGWRYQSKEKYSPWLRKLRGNKPPRYSRALLETLSIIAYRQPVTRGDIEEIRGVGVSSETIRTLEERGWVTQIGHRDVPGRPSLFGTTQGFLEYFNMASLRELPELMDKRELGEIAKDMNLTLPMDRVQDDDEAAKQKADEAAAVGDNEQQNSEQEDGSADVIELHPNDAEDAEQASALEKADEEVDSESNQLTDEQKDDHQADDDG